MTSTNVAPAKVLTPLVPVDRTHYNGKNMLRDSLAQADPEAYEIMKDVSVKRTKNDLRGGVNFPVDFEKYF